MLSFDDYLNIPEKSRLADDYCKVGNLFFSLHIIDDVAFSTYIGKYQIIKTKMWDYYYHG